MGTKEVILNSLACLACLSAPLAGAEFEAPAIDRFLASAAPVSVAGTPVALQMQTKAVTELLTEPRVRAPVIGRIKRGVKLWKIDETRAWYYVMAKIDQRNQTGWVPREAAEFVAAQPAPKPGAAPVKMPSGSDILRALVVEAARQYKGKRYGSTTHVPSEHITTPLDCSGLVFLAYKAAGLTIPRTAREQRQDAMRLSGMEKLKPGDLIFRPRDSSEYHVKMVVEASKHGIWVIEALESGTRVEEYLWDPHSETLPLTYASLIPGR
ncbi:MAG: NlpC/P60 family protein [Elusimicrobia bacterium]|nr:NlpC/P60 family protein [Elusimicrobiota bacterium]